MIAAKIAAVSLASLFALSGGSGCKKKATSDPEFGPDCETEFDKEKFQDKYVQCKGCEQHRGMGTMEKDCKNAIANPWK